MLGRKKTPRLGALCQPRRNVSILEFVRLRGNVDEPVTGTLVGLVPRLSGGLVKDARAAHADAGAENGRSGLRRDLAARADGQTIHALSYHRSGDAIGVLRKERRDALGENALVAALGRGIARLGLGGHGLEQLVDDGRGGVGVDTGVGKLGIKVGGSDDGKDVAASRLGVEGDVLHCVSSFHSYDC